MGALGTGVQTFALPISTWASRSLVTGVMAIGTFCMLSERLFAVTTISAIPASGGCADSCAAASLAARQPRLTVASMSAVCASLVDARMVILPLLYDFRNYVGRDMPHPPTCQVR